MDRMNQTNWRHFDFWLLGAVVLLTIFGITMIRSAVAGNIELTEETNLVNRQLIFAILGVVVLVVVTWVDYHLWASIIRPVYIGTALAMLLLNVIGNALFGSARWFRTAIVFIQPSEFAKLTLILALAHYFANNRQQFESPKVMVRSLLLAMGLTIWVILQPNLSTSIVMIVLWGSLLWAAGFKIKHLLIYGGIGLVLVLASLPILIETEVIKPYQLGRVTSFLFPDPEARFGDEYNIEQALISIGSGGLLGQGYNQGTQVQLRFLKIRWSDFIFAALSAEFGFVGAVTVMLLILFVVIRCLRAARLARDNFGGLIAIGVATMIAFQAIVNIGVNLRMVPATGLTLPFVSYGGSSLFSILVGIGLVESVILRHKSLEF